MSLLDAAMEPCVMLDKRARNDGYGGVTNSWSDGAGFNAAITFDTSMQARVAEQNGVKSRYTVTTKRAVTLKYNDYFRRLRDGKIFHVTSDGDDRYSPAAATLDMRQVEAEEVKAMP